MITRNSVLSGSSVKYPIKHPPLYQVAPYLGCAHDCYFLKKGKKEHFCYVPKMQYSWIPTNWSSVQPVINCPEVLARELPKRDPGTIMFSFMTDPYQPLERKYCITRKCLEILINHQEWHVMILTKSDLVIRDLEIIKQLRHKKVGFTYISSSPVSDIAPHPKYLLDALPKLKDARLKTFLSIEPWNENTDPVGILSLTSQWVDEYILGKLNYFGLPKSKEYYRQETRKFLDLARKLKKSVHIKKELRNLLEGRKHG